jgi:hypothetical protein
MCTHTANHFLKLLSHYYINWDSHHTVQNIVIECKLFEFRPTSGIYEHYQRTIRKILWSPHKLAVISTKLQHVNVMFAANTTKSTSVHLFSRISKSDCYRVRCRVIWYMATNVSKKPPASFSKHKTIHLKIIPPGCNCRGSYNL